MPRFLLRGGTLRHLGGALGDQGSSREEMGVVENLIFENVVIMLGTHVESSLGTEDSNCVLSSNSFPGHFVYCIWT